MALTTEWRSRVEQWRNTLERLCYRKLSDVALSGFVTAEQLRPREALKRQFKPMPTGTPWGAKWEYAWFRGAVKLPKEAKGEWIVFRCGTGTGFCGDPGGEGRFIVNGREMGGRDWHHPQVILSTNARPGAKFDILMEAYAGHGPMNCGGGPVPHGELTVPEPPPTQQTVRPASLGIWDEEVFQAWVDVQTLFELRDKLDPDSLRVAEIDEGLRQFTLIADLELPRTTGKMPVPPMLATIRAARKRLKPLLACTNGSTSPLLYCYGHSHIDVAWLWPLAETERKCARTFATQLGLMEMYPEYKFLQSQPHLFRMTQRLYPDVYARIKAAAKKGQWLSEGGMWVEADTNVTGGEALIRQFLHGKRFYRDELGVDCELMWLPDVFGYSGAMPQIMAGCGIKYFSTQKIFWNYNGGDPFPYNTFWWEGIDGTRVLSHFHNDYNSQTNPATLIQRWKERVQKDGLNARIVPFGWGDGGGGPTRLHLEFLRRQRDLEGCPRTTIASPLDFFHVEEARRSDWPVYVGELYYQCHRGTYTTQARTKRGNRKCELALREAEMWGAAAAAAGKLRYPAKVMDEAWKGVLLNQFHDIIPGSSIHRVYEEAEALHAQVLATATDAAQAAARVLLRVPNRKSQIANRKSVAVFNSLSWDRLALVPLPKGFRGAECHNRALPIQRIGGTLYAEALVPSCGWTTLKAAKPVRGIEAVKATERGMENDCLRLRLSDRGEITSLVDKATGRELAAAPMNAFRLYKDVPRWFDAWDVDSTYELCPVELPEKAAIEVVATGPLAAVLRITRKINDSTVTQDVWLRRGSRRVEFRTKIDWRERHKLLKVAFPTTLHANEAIHEVQFGHLRRPTHRSRPFDADRFEVANQKWTALAEEDRGAAVLNDCKYGVNALGGSINLTLLRSPLAPDMTADQGTQEVTYALTAWNGSFFESELVREAYELNVEPLIVPGAAGEGSLFQLDAPNVVIETVKPAEDGSGDIVIRLYEAKRAATRCTLRTSLPISKALSTNMLEERGEPLPMRGGLIALDLRPFEIKTLRLKLS